MRVYVIPHTWGYHGYLVEFASDEVFLELVVVRAEHQGVYSHYLRTSTTPRVPVTIVLKLSSYHGHGSKVHIERV